MATSISFQSWGSGAGESSSLKDVLQRVNLERGHFRDITEESLQEEIAGEGALETSSSEDAGDDDEAEERASTARHRPMTRDELFKCKKEMLERVHAAEQDVLMALDFVSLLESKYEPGRASSTISPVLKNSVPIGSFGMDVWHRMPKDVQRETQEEILATNVRMEGLQQSADGLLAAATRLQDNLEKETRYWEQIRSVSANGWNLLRLKRRQNRLGVHLGISVSAPDLANRNIVALDADAEGNCTLDSDVGTGVKYLRATIREAGTVTGVSRSPALLESKENILEARLRGARDSLYDEELYHHLVQESRGLASMGITTTDLAVTFTTAALGSASTSSVVSFQLVSVDGDNAIDPEVAHDCNDTAQAMVLAARILLGQSKREALRQKSQIPPPLSQRVDKRPPFPILRTLVALLKHLANISQLNEYLKNLESILQSAHIRTECSHATLACFTSSEIHDTDALVSVFLRPLHSSASLTIHTPSSDAIQLDFGVDSSLKQDWISTFSLKASPKQTLSRLTSLEDLSAATDGILVSALARAVHATMPDGWTCRAREGTLRQAPNQLASNLVIRIDLDSARQMLTFASSSSKQVHWTIDRSEETAFWDAWKIAEREDAN